MIIVTTTFNLFICSFEKEYWRKKRKLFVVRWNVQLFIFSSFFPSIYRFFVKPNDQFLRMFILYTCVYNLQAL